MKINTHAQSDTTLRFLGGIFPEYISAAEIVFLESDKNYTIFYLADGRKLLSARTLQVHETRLNELPHFFRTNRNSIVNIQYVNDIKLEKVESSVCLNTGKKIVISRRRLKEFKELINQI